jgi:hypothetical protein
LTSTARKPATLPKSDGAGCVQGQGWFLAVAAFQRHIKFTFFKGSSLEPVPPAGQQRNARALDVRESDSLDERQMANWIKQAAAIPGWGGG